MNETDRLIDAALDSYPLVPLPPRFVQRSMAAVRAVSRPRFRLEFLDLALPGFVILFTSTLALLGFWLLNVLQPRWLLILQVRASWYAQNLDIVPLGFYGFVVMTGLSVFVLAGLVVALALDRPVRILRI